MDQSEHSNSFDNIEDAIQELLPEVLNPFMLDLVISERGTLQINTKIIIRAN